VLNLVLYSAVFVPLERFFALRAEQPVFRRQWVVDLTYFFVNSLIIEILSILTLKPALIFFDWARVRSTGTSPSTRRSGICCSGRITSLIAGLRNTESPVSATSLRAGLRSSSIHSGGVSSSLAFLPTKAC
jgi:hypothetical protein